MEPEYREMLGHIRKAFPQPVSDRVHDSYFVHSFMRAVEAVDTLKTGRPILGERGKLDYTVARNSRLEEKGSSVETVAQELVQYCSGLTLWGHPQAQQNVVPPVTISSLIGVLLSSLYNPNLSWEEYSHRVAFAEVEVTSMMARLVGYDPQQAAGMFTFGGTGTSLYGIKIGLEKALPGAMEHGIREDAAVFASDSSHYCRYNVAGWLGLGAKNLLTIPTTVHNAMDLKALRSQMTRVLQDGRKIGGMIATMGTTDAFGVDDLQEIVMLRDELVQEFSLSYRPHIHADAVIGWAWSVFNDYSFKKNSLVFVHGRCVRWREFVRTCGIFLWQIQSGLIFTSRDSCLIFPVSSLFNRRRIWNCCSVHKIRCRICINSASNGRVCFPWKPRGRGRGCLPHWPI